MTSLTVLAGRLGLVASLAAAAFVVLSVARAGEHPDERTALRIRWASVGALAATAVSFALLVAALLRDDFGVAFVAAHHSSAASWPYSITAAWSGLEGSLLLWALITTGFGAVLALTATSGTIDRLGLVASGVVAGVSVFFVGVVLFVEPVFEQLAVPPADGAGTNPLLQDHLMMVIHPPILYAGYIGFVVPFAFAVAALWTRDRSIRWVRRTQRWALVAWTLLSLGILLGGWWSYEVLGWGGYWAWDPVENASLLPWISGTAYLHSATVHARRGLLPLWSVGLALSTYLLVVLGTFLARSGMIVSVHAFTTSSLGPVLLVFLVVLAVGSGWLLVTRGADIAPGPKISSLLSREGTILVNNLLLTFFAVVVLVGSIAPVLFEAFGDRRISVGRPYFDAWAVWITLALLAMMAIAVVAPPDRRAAAGSASSSLSDIGRRLRGPFEVAVAATALAVLAGARLAPLVVATQFLGTVVVATAVAEFVRAVRERWGPRGAVAALAAALRAAPSRWAGHAAHVGVAVMALGIAVSTSTADRGTVQLQPGQRAVVAGIEVTYLRPTSVRRAQHDAQGVELRLVAGEDSAIARPELRRYPNRTGSIGVPSVWTSPRATDVYVSLNGLDASGATVQVIRYPWLILVWVGSLVIVAAGVLGTSLRWWRRRSERSALVLLGDAGPGDGRDRDPSPNESEPAGAGSGEARG
jgi:cytochrome c-type biogenesis protein CcmF